MGKGFKFLRQILNKAESHINAVQKEIAKNPNPTFDDVKKEAEAVAILMNEPVDHIICELYGYLIGKKVAVNSDKEVKDGEKD